jgi:signal peptidase I
LSLPTTTPPDAAEAPGAPDTAQAPAPSRLHTILREILETILLTALIYAAVNLTTGRFRVEGDSMQPTLHPDQYVLVDKVSYRIGDPQRGDVVVFQYPLATERDFIKRVIGLPGEAVSVANGAININGQPLNEPYIAAPPAYTNTWVLGPDEYFVLGDNRNNSSDSHNWGPLKRQYLIGRAIAVYWPPDGWGLVPHYTYASAP